MISEKQLMANRRNAALATGPRTAAGRARAARNATVHGLTSKDLVIEGEKAAELAAFREAMVLELGPAGELQSMLADQVVSAAWRLRRAGRYERYMLESEIDDARRRRAEFPGLDTRDPRMDLQAAVWRTIRNGCYEKLTRYESHIEHVLYRALHELQRHQAAEQGVDVTPPAAVDVTVTHHGVPAGAE